MKIDNNFWINVDKPEGYSSAKVVAIVKKITKAKTVGHAGTLDPFATGVLPIAVGRGATRTVQHIMDAKKKYYFEITWGEFRDSDDKTGNVIQSSDLRPTNTEIINALSKFVGEISQIPSSFSAIKVDGKRSYELAREGSNHELKPRRIKIDQIKLIFNNSEKAGLEVTCSKGTYIRSIARDLSKELGVCGYTSTLRRLEVGNFNAKDGISLDKLKNVFSLGVKDSSLLQLRDVLNFIPEIELDSSDADGHCSRDQYKRIKNGQFVHLKESNQFLRSKIKNHELVKVIFDDALVALASLENGVLKPVNNLNFK